MVFRNSIPFDAEYITHTFFLKIIQVINTSFLFDIQQNKKNFYQRLRKIVFSKHQTQYNYKTDSKHQKISIWKYIKRFNDRLKISHGIGIQEFATFKTV